MQNKVQSDDTKYAVFTEKTMKTAIISSLTYWKSLNKRIKNWYNLLILKKLVEKTTYQTTSIRIRIETNSFVPKFVILFTYQTTSIRIRIETN